MAVKGKAAGVLRKSKTRPTKSVSMKEQEAIAKASGGTVRAPRQKRLPGMEDAKLDELHTLSEDYVKVRDRRIALNKEEKPLKDQLLAAMHRHGKTHYHHNGLLIDVIHENEKVRVKLTKDGDEESEGASA
jgi:hypothetical protein